MATTIRGSLGGKEKRGTSPSSSLTKKTLKPSSQTLGSSSSSPSNQKRSSHTDVKSVPNYLKPTKSSNLDITKRSSTDSAQKPLLRRRSFDRPPPTSQLQKAIRNVPGIREVKSHRSTSFSNKIGTSSVASSTRLASDRTYARTSSALKEGKIGPDLSKSRSIKKSTLSSPISGTAKKVTNGLKSSLSTKKGANSVTSESSIDHLVDEDDLVNMDIEVQSLPEMSEMPDTDQDLGDPTIILTDVEAKHLANVENNVDDQVVEETGKNVDHKQEKKEEQNVENQAESQNVEQSSEEQNVTVEDEQNPTAEEHQNPTAEEQNPTTESNAGDKEEQNVEQAVIKSPEENKEEAELEQEAKKSVDENTSVSRPAPQPVKAQTVVGKKDKQDYNNVIEETATKLMGGRKNKVLALAGAFETVISLQDTTNN